MANGRKSQTRSRARLRVGRRSVGAALRNNFLTGLVVVAPVVITIYIIWGIITFVDSRIVPWVPTVYNPSTYIDYDVPGFGLFVFFVFTTAVGYFTKNLFGRTIVRTIESWVDRMPFVRSIYNALKQIVETIFSQSANSFQKACLIEYPRRGAWVDEVGLDRDRSSAAGLDRGEDLTGPGAEAAKRTRTHPAAGLIGLDVLARV